MSFVSTPLPPAAAMAARSGSRVDQLRAVPRKPGEASFFFYDAHFKADAVKVLPGEYFVHDEDLAVLTTLGSCIAACLWDRDRHVGGLNHFMLPEATGGNDSGRYGAFAMELLINEMMKRGAKRSSLEAKVFGGGQVIGGMSSMNVGQRNTDFVLDYLKTERVPVMSKDVLDIYPRKVCFFPASGRAMVKRLPATHSDGVAAQDRDAQTKVQPVAQSGGSVDLF